MHLPSVGNEESEPFSKKRWDTFCKCCSDWKETDGIERTIVENTEPLQHLECEDLPSGTGFHPTCYRWFVDKKRIATARKRQTAKAESAQQRISSPKLLRSRTEGSGQQQLQHTKRRKTETTLGSSGTEKSRILPPVCIICKKIDRFITAKGKRTRAKLVKAETVDGANVGMSCRALTSTLLNWSADNV
ncbi:uncharacterized protein LOC132888868 isoform X2 [Neoarius graeffei]|uniref:uncharacterized protein LOC132888868 isoform X2 n=1 Tax=Neoarius graeffei TaxID=443677 RepID=UPI00298C2D3B|nr:uncharacterized protein LOC132888868 isoform X2 [Neoarius graeffei]